MFEDDLTDLFEDRTPEGILNSCARLLAATGELVGSKRAAGIVEDCLWALRKDARDIGVVIQ